MKIDKYKLYREAVQSPENDVRFLQKVYQELNGKKPKVLREDFCGTAALGMEWARLEQNHISYGVDLDPEPLEYGKRNYLPLLKPDQQKRIQLIEGNVLTSKLPKADISVALNFSYFLFKRRDDLRTYFSNVKKSLNPKGLAVFDVFGGSQCHDAIEDRNRLNGFTYYWEQASFDPVSNEAQFYIHFRVGKKKYQKQFSYDWRMWSIPELRDLLYEVGFHKTYIYWEGTTRKGDGNGKFTLTEKGEPCLSWVAYIVAENK